MSPPRNDGSESEEPRTLVNHGDMIRGDKILIQARKVDCHRKPRAYSSHGRNTAAAYDSAEAWISKELRYVIEGKEKQKRLKQAKKGKK